MQRLLILFIVLFHCLAAIAQPSDFISVRKKNNRTVKTYMPGSPIRFSTVYGSYISGWIADIRNDSVFVKEYDIRTLPTQFGTTVVDTVGSYLRGVAVADISKIEVDDKEHFVFIKNGMLCMIGGGGYAALNLINGAYLDEPMNDPKNVRSLGISLGVAGAGFLMNRLYHHKQKTGKKYKILYINMNDSTIQKARKAF
jgi:hypothetical protein